MEPLSKLWVMVEQVNSGSGSSSTVEMNTVLELLEKTVLLIGQHIWKKKKMFYWV